MCERRRELVVAENTRGGEDVIGARGGDGAGGAVAQQLAQGQAHGMLALGGAVGCGQLDQQHCMAPFL